MRHQQITILAADGSCTEFPLKSKQQVARDIVDRMQELM